MNDIEAKSLARFYSEFWKKDQTEERVNLLSTHLYLNNNVNGTAFSEDSLKTFWGCAKYISSSITDCSNDDYYSELIAEIRHFVSVFYSFESIETIVLENLKCESDDARELVTIGCFLFYLGATIDEITILTKSSRYRVLRMISKMGIELPEAIASYESKVRNKLPSFISTIANYYVARYSIKNIALKVGISRIAVKACLLLAGYDPLLTAPMSKKEKRMRRQEKLQQSEKMIRHFTVREISQKIKLSGHVISLHLRECGKERSLKSTWQKIHENRVAKVVELYEGKFSLTDICHITGHHMDSVRKWLKKKGYYLPFKKTPKSPRTIESAKVIVEYVTQGYQLSNIAKILQLSNPTCYRHFHAADLTKDEKKELLAAADKNKINILYRQRDKIEMAKELVYDGIDLKDIAKQLDVCIPSLRSWLRMVGFQYDNPMVYHRNLVLKVTEIINQGGTIKSAAATFNFNHEHLGRILKSVGYKLPTVLERNRNKVLLALEMIGEGKSFTKTATALKTGRGNLRKWLKLHEEECNGRVYTTGEI